MNNIHVNILKSNSYETALNEIELYIILNENILLNSSSFNMFENEAEPRMLR